MLTFHFSLFAHSGISTNLPITCQFFIIIKSTTTHFIFSLTGARDMGNYIFFPVPSLPLPSSLAIPLFALQATVPSVLTIFFNYCYFLLE